MKRIFGAMAVAAVLVGCATNAPSASIANLPGVQLERDAGGNVFVGAYETAAALKSGSSDKLLMCVTQSIVSRSVTLTGTATTVGAFSGRLINTPSVQTVQGGGSVVRYVSDDKRSVVAEGSETRRGTGMQAMIQRNVRYTVAVNIEEQQIKFRFSNLEQAQLDSGSAANSGFIPVGAWEAAKPQEAITVLQSVADKISGCM